MTETILEILVEVGRALAAHFRGGGSMAQILDRPLREILSTDAVAVVDAASARADRFVDGG